MVLRSMTGHFRRRWRQRVGGKITLKGVNALMPGARRVRRQALLYRSGHSCPQVILAEWWLPDPGVIVRVDEVLRQAVTVFRVPGTPQRR